mgnify:CR=1 FL=1
MTYTMYITCIDKETSSYIRGELGEKRITSENREGRTRRSYFQKQPSK